MPACPSSPPHPSENIPIQCPNCQQSLGSCSPAIRYLRFPSIQCKLCGFDGPYEWVNPSLGTTVDEERARLEHQKSIAYSLDTPQSIPFRESAVPQV